jgi:hypothetical protein
MARAAAEVNRASATPSRTFFSVDPPSGPVSPVCPGPGTNGEELATIAAADVDELADAGTELLNTGAELVDGGGVVVDGGGVVVDGGGVVVDGGGVVVDGGGVVVDGGGVVVDGGGVVVDGGGLVEGGPQGPWLKLNCPDHPV